MSEPVHPETPNQGRLRVVLGLTLVLLPTVYAVVTRDGRFGGDYRPGQGAVETQPLHPDKGAHTGGLLAPERQRERTTPQAPGPQVTERAPLPSLEGRHGL